MKIVIINLIPILHELVPFVKEKIKDDPFLTRLNPDSFIDSCIIKSFNRVYNLCIEDNYRSIAYEQIYISVSSWLDSRIFHSINSRELNIFTDERVKAIMNEECLFLTTSGNYDRYYV